MFLLKGCMATDVMSCTSSYVTIRKVLRGTTYSYQRPCHGQTPASTAKMSTMIWQLSQMSQNLIQRSIMSTFLSGLACTEMVKKITVYFCHARTNHLHVFFSLQWCFISRICEVSILLVNKPLDQLTKGSLHPYSLHDSVIFHHWLVLKHVKRNIS